MRIALLPAVAAPVLAAISAAPAAGAERFLGVSVEGRVVEVTSTAALVASSPGGGPYRTVGLDRRADGTLVALRADGALQSLDPATRVFTPLLGGGAVASAFAIEGRSTFALAPDDGSVLVARTGAAQRIDLTTGAVSAAATGSVRGPALDHLPDGRLVGIDGARRAVVLQQPDGSFRELAGVPVELHGPTRFTLSPDGRTGWLVTRSTVGNGSQLVAVNVATGATDAPGVLLPARLDAVAAVGPVPGDAATAPPAGAPVAVGTSPPARFATYVKVDMAQRFSARAAIRRGGFPVRIFSQGPVTVDIVVRGGGAEVARRLVTIARRVAAGTDALVRLRRGARTRLPRIARQGGRVVVEMRFTDSGGSQTRIRHRTVRP